MMAASTPLLTLALVLALSHSCAAHGSEMHMTMPMPAADSPYPCVNDPTMKKCADFVYPAAAIEADVTSLCEAMPFMVGCSLWNVCKASNNTADWCSPFVVVASTCTNDGMQKMKGCASYNSMCADGSRVQQCREHPPMPFMPTTWNTTDTVLAVCGERRELASSPGCKACASRMQCPQPLESLSVLCTDGDSSDMDACDSFAALCDEAEEQFSTLCKGKVVPQIEPASHSKEHGGRSTGTHGKTLLPEEEAARDVLAMCASHFMEGCQHCTSEEECDDPVALLAQICWGMPGMADCKAFFAACTEDEAAAEWPELCTEPGSLSAVVSDASSASGGGHGH